MSISLIVNGKEIQNFEYACVKQSINSIPHSMQVTYLKQDNLIKLNDAYEVKVDNIVVQRGIITDVKAEVLENKEGVYYTVRGLDNNNYLLHTSIGFYNYTDIYSEVPAPVNASALLDYFKISYNLARDGQVLFVPCPTDSLFSLMKDIASSLNLFMVSTVDGVSFIEKPFNKFNVYLLNSNILETDYYIKNNNLNNTITSFSYYYDAESIENVNCKSNKELIIRNPNNYINNQDYLKKIIKKQNIELYTIKVKLMTHSLGAGVLPLVNNTVKYNDNIYNVNTSMLITGCKFIESKQEIKTELELIESTIIDENSDFTGTMGDFISV